MGKELEEGRRSERDLESIERYWRLLEEIRKG